MWPFLQTSNTSCGCEQSGTNQCGCDKISSLDVSYNGPALACSGINLCDSLSVALQKIETKICTAGTVSGSGINNYVARWTPDGNTLGTGLIQDNGTTTSINTFLDNSWLFKMTTSSQRFTQRVENTYASSIPGNNSIGLSAISSGVNTGGNNLAINAFATNCTISNVGVTGKALGTSILNLGGYFEAIGGTTNVGARFYAAGGTDYAIQLQDNTQAVGKFLKSITVDGHANWANITTADITGFPSSIVGGSGTLNYVSKWTPDGMTLGNSQIQDSGDCVSVNSFLNFGRRLFVATSAGTPQTAIYGETVTSGQIGVVGSNIGVGPGSNVGVYGDAQGNTDYNYGVSGLGVSNNTATGIGVTGDAYGIGVSIGIRATALSGFQKYAAQLQDGTEAIGKVLTCQTLDGKANWVTPTTGITGSGTNGYVARWTPSGTQLGTGTIQDDGSRVGVNTPPASAGGTYRMFINTTNDYVALTATQSTTSGSYQKTGIQAIASGLGGSGENVGLIGSASGSTSANKGIVSSGTGTGTALALGGWFTATGTTTNKYSVQLQDGTEAVDKALTSVTSDGKANWNKISSSYTTGATGSFTSQDGKTITVTNGLITSIT